MIMFTNDYSEGCHPRILEILMATNLEQAVGYENDQFCNQARELIRLACQAPDADVHFFTGGTLTNLTVIAAALRPHQAVLSTVQGHIATNETGAIEATGHRVVTFPSDDGKMKPEIVRNAFERQRSEHVTQPKMVYISQSTELGTIYTKAELEALAQVCQECGFFLYMDGARLAYALAAVGNDLTLPDIARLCDAFYIGGNKCGALTGEAVVITNPILQQDFRHIMKQNGALTAKGRLLGIQFIGLFEDDLYFKIGKKAVDQAMMIKQACLQKGYGFRVDSPTNMQFPIMPTAVIAKLREKYSFGGLTRIDENHSAVRIVTSWATKEEDTQAFCADILALTEV
ncbi:MAG: aminotransferase class V-fold PLP-dependent enzyme [Symbiobacteriaceae bacterium]|nr:aminotransferase class V-fold PLP-dependent enzyme [Symbiobacteriaceae bacterium]